MLLTVAIKNKILYYHSNPNNDLQQQLLTVAVMLLTVAITHSSNVTYSSNYSQQYLLTVAMLLSAANTYSSNVTYSSKYSQQQC